jgi:hypothetical protein
MPYTLATHLENLRVSLSHYDQAHPKLVFSSPADEDAYKALRLYLDEVLRLGLQLENTSSLLHPLKKMAIGREMKCLAKAIFKSEDEVPAISGVCSCEFAKVVYLPHLARGDALHFNDVELKLASWIGAPVEVEKAATRLIAATVATNLKPFEAASSSSASATPPAAKVVTSCPASHFNSSALKAPSPPPASQPASSTSRMTK